MLTGDMQVQHFPLDIRVGFRNYAFANVEQIVNRIEVNSVYNHSFTW